MILTVLRALFVLLMAAVGWTFVLEPGQALGPYTWMSIAIAMTLAVLIICTDILAPRRKMVVFSCIFTGLVVGVLVSYALSFVVTLLVDYAVSYINSVSNPGIAPNQRVAIIQLINLLVGVASCYIATSFVLQTGDDFRFIIPYVEFRKQTRGARPVLLDTNVLIDGRILEIIETGVIECDLLVPQFVVKELRTLGDSADKLKRNRGKHGQEMLQKLTENLKISCRIYDSHARDERGATDVDDRLLLLAIELNAKVMTTDIPLAQEAKLKNVDVINLNELAMKLKPRVMPGERIFLEITKTGEGPGQGVGHLSDGTMVVVEDGRGFVQQEVEVIVTNTIQTSAGKMIFGRMADQRRAAAG